MNDAIHEPATALSSAPQRLLMIATALTAQLDTRLNSLSSAPARSFIERAARSIESRQPLLGSKNARRSLPSPAHTIASRGRSPRVLISKFCSSSTCWMQHQRSSFAIRSNYWAGFNRSRCVTLAPKPTWKSVSLTHIRCRMLASFRATAVIAHSMLDRLAIRSRQARLSEIAGVCSAD